MSPPCGHEVAHELRNRLVPLSNSLTTIRLVLTDDPDLARACDLALRQVDSLRELADRLDGPLDHSDTPTDVLTPPKPRQNCAPAG